MATSRSTSRAAGELGLTPHEVRLLRAYFRRHTRPYLIGLLFVVAVLGVSSSVGLPMRGGESEQQSIDALRRAELAAVELRSNVDTELASLRSELRALETALGEDASPSSASGDVSMHGRLEAVDSKLGRVARRLDALERRAGSVDKRLVDLSRSGVDRSLVDASSSSGRVEARVDEIVPLGASASDGRGSLAPTDASPPE